MGSLKLSRWSTDSRPWPYCDSRSQMKHLGWCEEEEDCPGKTKSSPWKEPPPFFWKEMKWFGPRVPGVGKAIFSSLLVEALPTYRSGPS